MVDPYILVILSSKCEILQRIQEIKVLTIQHQHMWLKFSWRGRVRSRDNFTGVAPNVKPEGKPGSSFIAILTGPFRGT